MGCCFSAPVDFDSEVNLFHFELHRAVGRGAFGKVSGRYTILCDTSQVEQVRVVEHKKTKQVYALKYIDKSRCVKQKAVANTIQERRLLEEVRRACRLAVCSNHSVFHSSSTILSSSICDMLFKTMKIASLSWTLCSGAIFDVSHVVSFLFVCVWKSNVFPKFTSNTREISPRILCVFGWRNSYLP